MSLSDEVIDVIGCIRNQDAIGHEERTLLADTLEECAWKAEMYERLHRSFFEPTRCDICGELAACIGWSSDLGVMAMCNEHCGHGNEDHVCEPVLAHC